MFALFQIIFYFNQFYNLFLYYYLLHLYNAVISTCFVLFSLLCILYLSLSLSDVFTTFFIGVPNIKTFKIRQFHVSFYFSPHNQTVIICIHQPTYLTLFSFILKILSEKKTVALSKHSVFFTVCPFIFRFSVFFFPQVSEYLFLAILIRQVL